MKRIATALVSTLILLAGCATESTAPEAPQDRLEAEVPGEKQSKKDDGRNKAADKKRKHGGESPEEASAAAGDAAGDDGSEDRDGGDSSPGGSGTRNAAGSSNYPAAGTYTFAQSGHEEFCDTAGNCDKQRLPRSQPVRVSYASRSGSSAVVVAEQKSSRSRLARTWTEFTPSGARVTKVYVRFEYSGFRFERTYDPQPPVEALRFPLSAGARWSGAWRASTSGSYQVQVGAPRNITIAGKNVDAYPVTTTMDFRGDFSGKSRITAYVDPDSKAVIATNGVLNVTSQFGRYSTVFDTNLVNGPGY